MPDNNLSFLLAQPFTAGARQRKLPSPVHGAFRRLAPSLAPSMGLKFWAALFPAVNDWASEKGKHIFLPDLSLNLALMAHRTVPKALFIYRRESVFQSSGFMTVHMHSRLEFSAAFGLAFHCFAVGSYGVPANITNILSRYSLASFVRPVRIADCVTPPSTSPRK